MVGPDAFEGQDEAHLVYARALPGDAGAALLVERAARDLGRHAERRAGLWFTTAHYVADRIDAHQRAALAEVALRVAKEGSVEAARPYLSVLAYFIEQSAPHRLPALFAWVEASPDPGDADAVAKLLCSWMKQEPSTPAYLGRFVGLARWLLRNGGGILRSSEHALMLPFIVDIVCHHAPDQLELALRYIVRNAHGAAAWTPHGPEILWPALEACRARGDGRGLLADLLELPGASHMLSTETFFMPLLDPNLPHARLEMLRTLAEGHFSQHRRTQGWTLVMCAPAPDSLEVASIDALLACAEALREVAASDHDLAREWAAWFTREHLRLGGLRRSACAVEGWLVRTDVPVAARPALQAGIRDSLEGALAAEPDRADLALARSILREHEAPEAVSAALFALPDDAQRSEPVPSLTEADLGAELTRIVNLRWERSRSGVDLADLLTGVREVEFRDLDDEDKVRLEPPRLLVARSPLARVRSADPDPDQCMRCALLYVLHELVHLAQGIGKKDTVLRMKRAGEYALLHLDLSADHTAALLLAEAAPRYRLLDLKDRGGRMLKDFPVGLFHANTASERKAVRLVSVRADFLARREGWMSEGELGDSYLFIDYPPGEGILALLANTNPVSVVKAVELSAPDARALANAARPPIDIDATDWLLLRLLGDAPKG